MKPSAAAWIWTELRSLGFAAVALWVVGAPAALAVLAMFVWDANVQGGAAYRVERVERWVEVLPNTVTYDRSGFAAAEAAVPNFQSATWVVAALPDSQEFPEFFALDAAAPLSRVWLRFSVVVPSGAAVREPMAIYGTRFMGGPPSVWVNSRHMASGLDNWRTQWTRPLLAPVSRDLVQPGQTLTFAVVLPFRVAQGYAIGSLYVGGASDLRHSYELRLFFQRTLPIFGMVLAGFMGLASLALWARRRSSSEHLWLALLSVALIICNLQFTHDFSDNAKFSHWFGYIVDAATQWVFLLYVLFVMRFGNLHYPRTEAIHVVYTMVMAVVTLPIWDLQVNGLRLQHSVTIAFYLYIAGFLTWIAFKRRRPADWLFSIAIWFFLGSGLHDITYLTSYAEPDRIFLFPYGAFLLFFLAEFLTQQRYLAAVKQVESHNATLDQRLREREAELLVKQTALVASQRQQAQMAERERLVQDIHDGIGSMLVKAMHRLRAGNMSSQSAANLVQECLDEMRIVIESLEPGALDITTLLSGMRHRFGDRLEAVGLQLAWHMDDLPELKWFDAAHALDVLRIIQEIVTNTLKHAKATSLSISATYPESTGNADKCIWITLQDNGQGFDPDAVPRGRGLKNIQTRVSRLNAQLEMTSTGQQGTCYALRLPVNGR